MIETIKVLFFPVLLGLVIWGVSYVCIYSDRQETVRQDKINKQLQALHFKKDQVDIFLENTPWSETNFLSSPGIQKAYVNFSTGRCSYNKKSQ